MRLQNLNRRRGGGQYFVAGELPVFVERGADGWRLYAQVPGFREAFLVDRGPAAEGWTLRLHRSARLLKETGLRNYRFRSRREALETFRAAMEMAS